MTFPVSKCILTVSSQMVQLVQMIQLLGKGGDDMIEINSASSQQMAFETGGQHSVGAEDGAFAVCDTGDGGKSVQRAGAAASDRDNSWKRSLYRRDGKDTAFGAAERAGKTEIKRSLRRNDLSWFFEKRDCENGG